MIVNHDLDKSLLRNLDQIKSDTEYCLKRDQNKLDSCKAKIICLENEIKKYDDKFSKIENARKIAERYADSLSVIDSLSGIYFCKSKPKDKDVLVKYFNYNQIYDDTFWSSYLTSTPNYKITNNVFYGKKINIFDYLIYFEMFYIVKDGIWDKKSKNPLEYFNSNNKKIRIFLNKLASIPNIGGTPPDWIKNYLIIS